MTITNLATRQDYIGNGATTTFAIPFQIIEDESAETKVWLRDENVSPATQVLQTEGADYNLTGAVPPAFATDVEMVVAPATGELLIVIRAEAKTQITDYEEDSEFPAESTETALDKLTAIVQDICEKLSRTLVSQVTTQITDLSLPPLEADKMLAVDAAGLVMEFKSADDILNLTGALAIANNLSDLSSVATALVNLGIQPYERQGSDVIADNASATDVNGLVVLGATHSSAVFDYEIRRRDDGQEVNAVGSVRLWREVDSGNWQFEIMSFAGDVGIVDVLVPAGVTFTIVQTVNDVKIQTASDNMGGANYAGTIKFSLKRFEV